MRYWTRELAGWVLIVFGLFLFYRSYVFLTGPSHYVIEAGAIAIMGFVLFRGGIHLLKIAVAARICLETEKTMKALDEDLLLGGRSMVRRPTSTQKQL